MLTPKIFSLTEYSRTSHGSNAEFKFVEGENHGKERKGIALWEINSYCLPSEGYARPSHEQPVFFQENAVGTGAKGFTKV